MPVVDIKYLHTPEDSTVVWRYLDFSKFVALLSSGTMWFARADQFEDQWEGHYPLAEGPEPTAERLLAAGHEPEIVRLHGNLRHTMRYMTYLSCWNQSSVESAAMWKLYLPSGSGVAIRSTVGRMRAALKRIPETVHLASVRYIDFELESFHPSSFLTPYAHKRRFFSYENELRGIVVHQPETMEFAMSVKEGCPPDSPAGVAVQVDPEELIDSVVLSPFAPGWLRRTIREVVERFGLNLQVTESALSRVPSDKPTPSPPLE